MPHPDDPDFHNRDADVYAGMRAAGAAAGAKAQQRDLERVLDAIHGREISSFDRLWKGEWPTFLDLYERARTCIHVCRFLQYHQRNLFPDGESLLIGCVLSLSKIREDLISQAVQDSLVRTPLPIQIEPSDEFGWVCRVCLGDLADRFPDFTIGSVGDPKCARCGQHKLRKDVMWVSFHDLLRLLLPS